MVTQMSRDNCSAIAIRIDEKLEELGKELGVSIKTGNGTYKKQEVTFKLKVSILDESGESKQGFEDFIRYALSFGFNKEDFGKDFTSKGRISKGRQFKIVGWDRRKRKYPVVVKEIHTGELWYFPPRSVLRFLGK